MARRIAPIAHEEQLTLVDHLDELRSRLVSSLLFVALVFAFAFWQSDRILVVIPAPIDHALSPPNAPNSKTTDSAEVQQRSRSRRCQHDAPA